MPENEGIENEAAANDSFRGPGPEKLMKIPRSVIAYRERIVVLAIKSPTNGVRPEGRIEKHMTECRKILVMGLPGSGKTTLATELVSRLRAVHFNADEVRRNVNKDLGFSDRDRVEQAKRMGWLCDQVAKAGAVAVADFICPTDECRQAFKHGGDAFIVWVDRTDSCQYEDTNQLFSPPKDFDVRVTSDGSAKTWADRIMSKVAGPNSKNMDRSVDGPILAVSDNP